MGVIKCSPWSFSQENTSSFEENTINFKENTINFEENTINFEENTLQLPNICKSNCVLLSRTLYNYPKSASLIVFYSVEHFTTTQYLQVYLCSTQENTLQLPISARLLVFYSGEHFTTTQYLHVYLCSTTQENTSQLPNICKSVCVQDFTFQV